MVAHLWVNIIVVPWHHLVEHRFAGLNQDSESAALVIPHEARPASKCRCHHHASPAKSRPVCDSRGKNSEQPADEGPLPAAPHHTDDCQVCQVLGQAFTSCTHPELQLAAKRLEFAPPVSAVQPLLGTLIEPVSRGPPSA